MGRPKGTPTVKWSSADLPCAWWASPLVVSPTIVARFSGHNSNLCNSHIDPIHDQKRGKFSARVINIDQIPTQEVAKYYFCPVLEESMENIDQLI